MRNVKKFLGAIVMSLFYWFRSVLSVITTEAKVLEIWDIFTSLIESVVEAAIEQFK